DDVGEDEDFKCGSWVSAIEYANANGVIVSGCLGDIKNFLKNGKLDQVLETVKSCTLDVLRNLTVTLEQLSAEVEAACALEVKVEATCLVGALDLLDISLNIIISAS
nr:hypothetical protein [Tanacetum cinerariifolium]